MKIFANGCSFTFGGGVNMYDNTFIDDNRCDVFFNAYSTHPKNIERLSITWPYQLADIVNAESAVNLAQGGGGNARIVRTTMDFFLDALARGEDVSEYFAVIQWSEISRREFFDGEHWINYNFNFSYPTDFSSTEYQKKYGRKKDFTKIDAAEKFYYRHLQSHQQDLTDFFEHVIALGGFLKQLKIPYLFCTHVQVMLHAITLNKQISDEEKEYWFKRVDQITPLHPWLNNSIWESSMLRLNLDPCAPGDSHPSVRGHWQFAKILHNWITRNHLMEKTA